MFREGQHSLLDDCVHWARLLSPSVSCSTLNPHLKSIHAATSRPARSPPGFVSQGAEAGEPHAVRCHSWRSACAACKCCQRRQARVRRHAPNAASTGRPGIVPFGDLSYAVCGMCTLVQLAKAVLVQNAWPMLAAVVERAGHTLTSRPDDCSLRNRLLLPQQQQQHRRLAETRLLG